MLKPFHLIPKLKSAFTTSPSLIHTTKMASSPKSTTSSPGSSFFGSPDHSLPSTSISEFHALLASSNRILALCGAGLSAASGLSTFRGAGGMWRNHQATTLATPEAFARDPGLVWLFYSYRRHLALQAKPNKGHWGLSQLARRKEGFLCVSQNVDGLHPRANHPLAQLKLVHGSLFDIKCFNCNYIEHNNYDDPFHPSLAITSEEDERLAPSANTVKARAAYLDPNIDTTSMDREELPKCPECKTGLLRPGVVWFGENLPRDTIREIDNFVDEGPLDIMLVIGTTAQVYPAARYVNDARDRGARIVVINLPGQQGELGSAGNLREEDFLFEGDAAEILPEILKPIIGELSVDGNV